MSHIDSYNHEFLAYFGFIPIYHPLQAIERYDWGEYDFGADPKNIVLGGGSGEHSGLVVHHLECLVARFILQQLRDDRKQLLDKKELNFLQGLASFPTEKLLEFCEWSERELNDFENFARSQTLGEPLKEGEKIEDWLCCSLGEFIFYSLPDLNPEHHRLLAVGQKIEVQPRWFNVHCSPPGYPLERGRNSNENGEVQWGVHRWK